MTHIAQLMEKKFPIVKRFDFANTQPELERTFQEQLHPLGCKKCLILVKKVPIITSIYLWFSKNLIKIISYKCGKCLAPNLLVI
jgi:hypothetical protein